MRRRHLITNQEQRDKKTLSHPINILTRGFPFDSIAKFNRKATSSDLSYIASHYNKMKYTNPSQKKTEYTKRGNDLAYQNQSRSWDRDAKVK